MGNVKCKCSKNHNIMLGLNVLFILKTELLKNSFTFLALKEASSKIFSKSTSLLISFSMEEVAIFDNFS